MRRNILKGSRKWKIQIIAEEAGKEAASFFMTPFSWAHEMCETTHWWMEIEEKKQGNLRQNIILWFYTDTSYKNCKKSNKMFAKRFEIA